MKHIVGATEPAGPYGLQAVVSIELPMKFTLTDAVTTCMSCGAEVEEAFVVAINPETKEATVACPSCAEAVKK